MARDLWPGWEEKAIAPIEPILRKLAIQDGYVHAGPPGAGHFTKLVHNGIEFGMLQAIAMMRHDFGGHPFGGNEAIVHERRFGRVGEFYQAEKK